MVALLGTELDVEAKALSCVILRRNFLVSNDEADNLWTKINAQVKAYIQTEMLKALGQQYDKSLMHKLADLVSEVGGSINDVDSIVWQDLINLLFQLVASGNNYFVESGLRVLNGLFTYISDEMVQYTPQLLEIFQRTLTCNNLDINVTALQAVSNLLVVIEGKSTKTFLPLMEAMVNVPLKALAEDEETNLEDSLLEFNDIAEAEPKFFKQHFQSIFQKFSGIMSKSDFTNTSIRHQPVEFLVTIVERVPSILKNNVDLLKALLDIVFKLMIDIDSDIEQSWMTPKEGYRVDEDEEEEDGVNFGKGCIDRLVSCIGEEKLLPLLSQLVQNCLQNEADWRYKHAGLMALSQVGEYIDDLQKISPMIPVVIQHFGHANPKVRYAAIHCIGQISDDMAEEFQENFHESVLPALINTLQDTVPRVKAHVCAAFTNFLEGCPAEVAKQYSEFLLKALLECVQNGISILKENAVTAIASLAEATKEEFAPYYDGTLNALSPYLTGYNEPCYRQFKGQVIESVTIISAAVGKDNFLRHSDALVQVMLGIQGTANDSRDPQRTYLLSAWQRICLLLGKDFAKYLPQLIPSLFGMAALNPEMSIQGQDKGDLADILSEVKASNDKGKSMTITTDAIEEKNVAIQMLAVFIDELGETFAPYVSDTSKILLPLTDYVTNDSIRNTVASALPGMIKCYSESAQPQQEFITATARQYLDALYKAMLKEPETETLICQTQAVKEIIEVTEVRFLAQDVINEMSKTLFKLYNDSDERKKENDEAAESGAKEDELDAEDIEVIKEENKSEDELQISISEVFGALFKSHKELNIDLVQKLFTDVLPKVLAPSSPSCKHKFGLFIVDDMLEFLGMELIGNMYGDMANAVIRYSTNENANVRQAAVYGIGLLAQFGGNMFPQNKDNSLVALKTAIEMPKGSQKKKHWQHATDNAVSSLGKMIRFQSALLDLNTIIPFWLQHLPLQFDLQEGKIQNELFCDILIENPAIILGEGNKNFVSVVKMLGLVYDEKYSNKETLPKISQLLKGWQAEMANIAANLTETEKNNIQKAVLGQ